MDVLLASTVMVVAAASLLVAFTLRTWSRTYQAGFNDMRKRILDHEKHILEVEGKISAAQAMVENLRDTVETQGRSKRDAP
jgi:hypothetical protein